MAIMAVTAKTHHSWWILGTLIGVFAVALLHSSRTAMRREIQPPLANSGEIAMPMQDAPPKVARDEEAQLVEDLLEHLIIPVSYARDVPNGVIILQSLSADMSWARGDFTWLQKNGDVELPATMFERFAALNADPRRWPADFQLSRAYRLVHPPVLDALFSNGGWQRVVQHVPGACELVTISRAAFSDDGQSAIVHYSFSQGALSGGGAWLRMRRTDEGWREDKVLMDEVY